MKRKVFKNKITFVIINQNHRDKEQAVTLLLVYSFTVKEEGKFIEKNTLSTL